MYNVEASNEFSFKHFFNMTKEIISASAMLFPGFSSCKMLSLTKIYFLPKDQLIGN